MRRIVAFGEIMARLCAPKPLRLSQANSFNLSFAGSEANVAVSLANFGMSTEFVTSLPFNPIADHCLRELKGYNVGVKYVHRDNGRMGLFYNEVGNNQRPSRVIYDRIGSSFATIKRGIFKWEEILQNACWFHWSGITPALSEKAAEECAHAISVAKRLNIPVSCDINFRKTLWKYGKKAKEVLPGLMSDCQIIIANEEDCEQVCDIKPQSISIEAANGTVHPIEYLSVCKEMLDKFPHCKNIAITIRNSYNANHNIWSAVLMDRKRDFYKSTTYEITDIVDRVGGGDSFSAGLIYGMLYYKEAQKALDFATAASCLKHTIKNDYNLVNSDEVKMLMNGISNGRIQR